MHEQLPPAAARAVAIAITMVGPIASVVCTTSVHAADFSFASPVVTTLTEGHTPTAVRLADLDGDGVVDAIVTGRNWDGREGSAGRIAVLRGAGNGSFTPWPDIPVAEGSSEDAVLVDLDGDKALDCAFTVSSARGRLGTAKGNGDGTFGAPVYIDLERQPRGLAALDADGDGDLDLAAINYSSASLMIARNDGGVFSVATTRRMHSYSGGLPYPLQVQARDINNDGITDLLTTATGAGRLGAARGSGSIDLPNTVDWKPAPLGSESPAVIGSSIADFDGDGDPDAALPVLVITQSQKLILLRNDGSGGFVEQSVFDSASFFYAWSSAAIDVDGDGRRDVAIGTALAGSVVFLRNATAGPAAPFSFVLQPFLVPYGVFVRDLAVADVDGDGDEDLVGAEIAGSTLFTLLNTTPQGVAGGPAAMEQETKAPERPGTHRRPGSDTRPPPRPDLVDRNGDGVLDGRDEAIRLEAWNAATGGAR